MRFALVSGVLGFLFAATSHAAAPSVTCSTELVRRQAIIASDYAQRNPPGTWWVSSGGQTIGPWPILVIKREMLIGRLPTGIWVHAVEAPKGWMWSEKMAEFDPLPGSAALREGDLGEGLAALMTGCWVSDPFSEVDGQETVWLFILFDNGVFFPSRGIRTLATGEEGFWFSRSSNAHWSVAGGGDGQVRLSLPDINFLDPVDDLATRVIDRNTIVITLPGTAGITFRRM